MQKPRKSFRFLDGEDMRPPWIPPRDKAVEINALEETPVQPFSPKPRKRVSAGKPAIPSKVVKEEPSAKAELVGELSAEHSSSKPKGRALNGKQTFAAKAVKEESSLKEGTESDEPSTSHPPPGDLDPTNTVARPFVPDVITHQDKYRVLKELETVKGFAPGVKLLPHQNHARQWMAHRETGKRRGGIIADDMGTGKTIQALVRIVDARATVEDKKEGWSGATLIVCPVALKNQWIREAARFAPGLRVLEHHEKQRHDPKILMSADIVVTTYGIVRSKTETALFGVRWLRIILDEAHEIRNRATQTAKACWELQSKFRWCMTGTPIQNKVEDLYPLFHFLGVLPLSEWDSFNEMLARPLRRGISGRAIQQLHVYLNGVMIRRKKDTLINGRPIVTLPPRTVNLVTCPFTSAERRFYDTVEAWITNQVWEMVLAGEIRYNYIHVLTWLLRLRQACDHPRLFYNEDEHNEAEAEPEARALLDEVDVSDAAVGAAGWRRPSKLPARVKDPKVLVTQKAVPDSAKIRAIVRLLSRIHERSGGTEKTIVYSQWTTMLDLIEPFLDDQDIRYIRYDGKMSSKKRTDAINTLATDSDITVALVSLKAGGIGLNLTMCNNVILTDPWWNPATEEQAFDRVHRLGQELPVHVYKLTTEDTIEGRILELQEKKRALAVAALSGERIKGHKLTLEEMLALFGIRAH
ncbi:hypothetical protein OE88DRAFT_1659198 [Heliocybe sulcata]|uniref:P-loop containing nucleoside triphosphate hydrolase protein n=1 Tax=Heliocybe sulcata TaxID=5364 RepID=A0A5C3NBR0_9AGAM|nr:hypothetical protein OE88DRAFT_1659198 [Heliocybe sulcata]